MNGFDLTIPPAEAHDLIRVIHSDERFEVAQVTSLDGEDGEDKKVRSATLNTRWPLPLSSMSIKERRSPERSCQFAVRRTTFASPPTTPALSDGE